MIIHIHEESLCGVFYGRKNNLSIYYRKLNFFDHELEDFDLTALHAL